MKIALRQLLPNPFRNLGGEYPIDQKKVEAIASSIRTTGFWDNLIVRESAAVIQEYKNTTHTIQGYEIAYGHHRLEALRLLVRQQLLDEDYELEFPARRLDDNAMVRIMCLENPIDKYAVRVVLRFISDGIRIPEAEITAEDVYRFVGSDWHERLPRIRGILKKLRQA